MRTWDPDLGVSNTMSRNVRGKSLVRLYRAFPGDRKIETLTVRGVGLDWIGRAEREGRIRLVASRAAGVGEHVWRLDSVATLPLFTQQHPTVEVA